MARHIGFKTVASINEVGAEEIKSALLEHHINPEVSDDVIMDWCAHIEHSIETGGGPFFEIEKTKSKTGKPVIIEIGKDGYSVKIEACND